MTTELTYRDAIRDALSEELRADPTVFLIGEDIGVFGGAYKATRGLLEEFGETRVRDTPVAEGVIIGTALGASLAGFRPVAEIMYIDFTTQCMDQIVNQAAKIRFMFNANLQAPIVIRTQGGGGRSNAAQHSQSLESWFMHVPGLKVAMPSTPYDAKGLLKSSIRDNNPVMFIEHKMLYTTKGPVPDHDYVVPLGVADIKRQGDDITVVAWSKMVLHALEAAEALAGEGIHVEVIDLRTLNPLDMQCVLDSVKKTGRLVIAEEGCKTAGAGAEIAAQVAEQAFDYLDAPIARVAARNIPVACAPVLEKATLPGTADIVRAIRKALA